MKKLHLTLITLLVLATAQAQMITEKDLLGEWKIARMDFGGVLADFETGEVTTGENAPDNADAEGLKAMMQSSMSDKLKSNRVAFKPGFVFETSEGDETHTGSYKLADDGTRQVLLLDTPEKMTIDITLKDGLLVWVLPSAQVFKMYFRKIIN